MFCIFICTLGWYFYGLTCTLLVYYKFVLVCIFNEFLSTLVVIDFCFLDTVFEFFSSIVHKLSYKHIFNEKILGICITQRYFDHKLVLVRYRQPPILYFNTVLCVYLFCNFLLLYIFIIFFINIYCY